MEKKTATVWMIGLLIYTIGIFQLLEASKSSFSVMQNLDTFGFTLAFLFLSAGSLIFYEEELNLKEGKSK